jgi:hypothetical protein
MNKGVRNMRPGKRAHHGEDLILFKGGRKMIRVSERAVEKLKETYQNRQKNLYRVFVSGMG